MTKTLVLSAPDTRLGKARHCKSFEQILATGIGPDYAIYRHLAEQITTGCRLVLICNDKGKRAEGTLSEIARSGEARNGVQRYNIRISGLTRVPFVPESLNRCGVSLR